MKNQFNSQFENKMDVLTLNVESGRLNIQMSLPCPCLDSSPSASWYEPFVQILKQTPNPLSSASTASTVHKGHGLEVARAPVPKECKTTSRIPSPPSDRHQRNMLLKNCTAETRKTTGIPLPPRIRQKQLMSNAALKRVVTKQSTTPVGTPAVKHIRRCYTPQTQPKRQPIQVIRTIFENLSAGLPSGTVTGKRRTTELSTISPAKKALQEAWDSVNAIYGSDQSGEIHKKLMGSMSQPYFSSSSRD